MVAPNYFTSKYGTKINVTGLSGKPLNRIQSLANSAHGMQAGQIANKQRKLLIPQANAAGAAAGAVNAPVPAAPAAAPAGAPATPGVPMNTSGEFPAKPNYFTSKYGTKIDVTGLSGKPLNRIQTLANSAHGLQASQIAEKQRKLLIPKAAAPVAGTPAAPAAPAPAVIPPLDTSAQAGAGPTGGTVMPGGLNTGRNSEGPGGLGGGAESRGTTGAGGAAGAAGNATGANLNTLFPNERMFEPQNYQGSPLYQFQVKSGMDQVDKSLAARGLTNSGAGIKAELNVPMQAAAQDTDRMTRIASENADRLKSFQDNEALRQERAGNNQWDRSYSLAQLMAQQSPMAQAMQGLNGTIDTTTAAGKAQANYLAQAYAKIMGGGGGGGGFTPATLPSGPDYGNIDLAKINQGASNSNGWFNILTNGLAGLLK